MSFVYINFYKTTLSAALTSTATTMTVSSARGLPTLTNLYDAINFIRAAGIKAWVKQLL